MSEIEIPYDGRVRALLGKLGWLFLCNWQTVGQLTGRVRLMDRQLDEYERAFQARWRRFETLEIPYVFAPIPMKELVHTEFLPEDFKPVSADLPRKRLHQLFDGSDMEIVNLHSILEEEKRSADVFLKTDTHLNAIGGYHVYETLARHRHCRDLGIEPKPIEQFPIRLDAKFIGDLSEKEKVVFAGGRLVPRDRADPTDRCEIALLPGQDASCSELDPRLVPSAYEVSKKHPTRIFHRLEGADLPSAVIVGDSFTEKVLPYIRAHFRRTVFVWAPNPPFSIIESERPDIVIQLIAERFLIRSPLMPDWELSTEPPEGFEPPPPHEPATPHSTARL